MSDKVKYSIKAPDGKTYSIMGPPGATRDEVIAKVQSRMEALDQEEEAKEEARPVLVEGETAAGTGYKTAMDAATGFVSGAADTMSSFFPNPVGVAKNVMKGEYGEAAKDVVPSIAGDTEWLARYAAYMAGFGPEKYDDIDPTLETTSERVASGDMHEGYAPKSKTGDYAQAVGAAAPAAAVGGVAGAGKRLLKFGAAPVAAGEAALEVIPGTRGTELEPAIRMGAGIATGIAPTAARRIASPLGGRKAPALGSKVKILEDEGIPVTAGKRTGSKFISLAESEAAAVLGGGGPTIQNKGLGAFTARMAKESGYKVPSKTVKVDGKVVPNKAYTDFRLTPEMVDQRARYFGQKFEAYTNDLGKTLTGKNVKLKIKPNQYTEAMLDSLDAQATNVGYGTPGIEKGMRRYIDQIKKALDNDAYTPEVHQRLRSSLTETIKHQQGQNKIPFGELLDKVDALGEGFYPEGSPQQKAMSKIRKQYREFKALKKAMGRSKEGLLSPKQMANALRSQEKDNYYQKASTRGRKSVRIANAAEDLLSDFSNSETAARQDARALLNPASEVGQMSRATVGTGVTGAVGASLLGPAGAFIAPAATATSARLLKSRPVQSWLKGNYDIRHKLGEFGDRRIVSDLGTSVGTVGLTELAKDRNEEMRRLQKEALAKYLKDMEKD